MWKQFAVSKINTAAFAQWKGKISSGRTCLRTSALCSNWACSNNNAVVYGAGPITASRWKAAVRRINRDNSAFFARPNSTLNLLKYPVGTVGSRLNRGFR